MVSLTTEISYRQVPIGYEASFSLTNAVEGCIRSNTSPGFNAAGSVEIRAKSIAVACWSRMGL